MTKSFRQKPAISKMTGQEYAAFQEKFPFKVRHLMTEHGTDHDRRLVRDFFQQINSEVYSSTNYVYFRTQTDMTLYQLGMWK
jgi:hypothetical protein